MNVILMSALSMNAEEISIYLRVILIWFSGQKDIVGNCIADELAIAGTEQAINIASINLD